MLRAVFPLLPRHRVVTQTRASRDGETFVRRHGKRLSTQLQEADALTDEGRVRPRVATDVLAQWLLDMAAPQRGAGNAFQWQGFHFTNVAEALDISAEAVRTAAQSV